MSRATQLALNLRQNLNDDDLSALQAEWNAVKARYPRLKFDARYNEMTGPGWWPVLEEMFQELSALDEQVTIQQIKEKFGGLRVHLLKGSDTAKAVINKATRTASHTCYFCGSPAILRTNRAWISTLCDEHATI